MFCSDFCLVLFWFLFVLSLYIEIFYYEIFLEAEKMVEKMWETSRKIAFSEYNQTLENIFQSIFWNATKHLKIFSFLENIFTWKYFIPGKYFTFSQTQPLLISLLRNAMLLSMFFLQALLIELAKPKLIHSDFPKANTKT